ncbi:MAG: hypothetical protein KDB55_00710 [Mycobacterium sp.]|nr:hypothetical protein [Mycobacterium sp.]
MTTAWEQVRAVADTVLYEGYLLYPYRASSRKNQCRWQFGVLGPPGAAEAGVGEEATLEAGFLIEDGRTLTLIVRFLQLQRRRVLRGDPRLGLVPVEELVTPAGTWLTWDEAVEREIALEPLNLADSRRSWTLPFTAPCGTDVEEIAGGQLVRIRRELRGTVSVEAATDGGMQRLRVTVANTGVPAADRDEAIATSLIGTHLIAAVTGGHFVSLVDPPPGATAAAARCRQRRCFPVLAGPPDVDDLLLISPIILYDHPAVAEQSDGALYDSTEIDEILTLRVMTMTDQEKLQARATDARAAAIIDRCDAMSPEAMQRLHGVLRDPHATDAWWDPDADRAVDPESDTVTVDGVAVARGSRVRLRPGRCADAQDIFVAGRTARVAAVHQDVDGNTHIAVVVEDDPAAELHDWYGRYLYFAPEEVEPLGTEQPSPEGRPKWRS